MKDHHARPLWMAGGCARVRVRRGCFHGSQVEATRQRPAPLRQTPATEPWWRPRRDHPAWSGWALRNGELFTPEGVGIRPGEVRSIPYRAHQIAELERQLKRVLEEIPRPGPVAFTVHVELEDPAARPRIRVSHSAAPVIALALARDNS